MANQYTRDANGIRLDIQGGMNTAMPPDTLPKGKYPYLQNVRRYLQNRTTARAPLGPNTIPSPLASPITSFTRMNDTTPAGPVSGFCLIEGTAAGALNLNSTPIVSGLTGNPLSYVTYRPNASPQPWCYTADNSASGVTLTTTSAETGSPATYVGNGMMKVRSDGLVWHMGIAEPQTAPTVTFPGGGTGTTQIFYRYVYRSAPIGAPSNPSPESIAGTNAQASPSESIPATAFATNYTFNVAQWEFSTPQLRTKSPTPLGVLDPVVVKMGTTPFSVPTNVNIDGVQTDLNWVGQNAGTGTLVSVQLYYLGAPIGSPKFPGTLNQSFSSDAYAGGNGDTWGATLTPAIVNDPSFGFGVTISKQNAGGSDRSFIDFMAMTVYYSTQNAVITPTASTDPQVNKIDIYRQGGVLANFTFVGTSDNSATPYTDTLSDLAAVDNPQLEFDNFEPFPSIDMPQKGVVSVAAGSVAGTMAVTWTSGNTFNIRWLPGTIIIIAGVAYTFYNRPTDTTHLTVILDTPLPSPTTNLVYEIQEPDLAAQPSPAMWGPTPDNAGAFAFGLDPLNTGDLLWTKGNNFDAAPDTNRLNVTSPSEPLMNGVITSELAVVFSTERFWLIYPEFAAIVIATGTVGTQWILIQSAATRGLYMRYALDALGARIAWRAKDCIAMSMGGGPEESITDDIYNLFPHEGFSPIPVQIGGFVVHPPDDSRPNAQTIKVAPGYILYNYQDVNGNPRTLCYDIEGKGWSVDLYTPVVNCHLWAAGPVDQLLVGAVDGTVRALVAGAGAETGNSIIATRSENGGDTRAFKRIGDIFVRALATATNPIAVSLWSSRVTNMLGGFSPTSLVGTGTLQPYILDFTSGFGDNLDDIAAVFNWPLGSGNVLDTWQPDWLPLPENTQDRPTDFDSAGSPGNKLFRGFLLEMDTLGNAKSIKVERSEDGSQFTPNESPLTVSEQTLKAFTFTPPFVSHLVRITSTDGVPWRVWGQQWVTDPWVEYAEFVGPWNNLGFQGAKYLRGLVLPMDTQGVVAEFRIATSAFTGVNFFATTPAAVKTTFSYAFTPPVIASEVQIRCLTATAGAWFEEARWDFDKYPEIIPEYTPIMETGGAGAKYFRGMTLTADTANVSTSFQILYDGGQTGPVITGTFNGKQTLAFAFVPFVFHDIQLVPQANARIWIEESKWHYDEYPELTPEYTPIMEISGPDNKFVQGMKLIADTANLPVTFQILFDGGQTGPSFTGTFNGKQTLVFSWPPFLAHDIQLVPQAPARIWWGGIGQGASEWVFQPFPESATNWDTELTSLGGTGWQHLRELNVEYISTTPITLVFTVDTGNGAIPPSTLTIPSSSGFQTKLKIDVTANKWKLLGYSATSTAPFNLFVEGTVGKVRSWGDTNPYRLSPPAGGPSKGGAQV